MNKKILFWPLAAVLLTACEKTVVSTDRPLVDDIEDVGSGQMANSVYAVGGASSSDYVLPATLNALETLMR